MWHLPFEEGVCKEGEGRRGGMCRGEGWGERGVWDRGDAGSEASPPRYQHIRTWSLTVVGQTQWFVHSHGRERWAAVTHPLWTWVHVVLGPISSSWDRSSQVELCVPYRGATSLSTAM